MNRTKTKLFPPQPNIILIHCHDLGDWLSVYQDERIPSPHLANFAAESIVFDQAFATSPLCTPARSSLFSGLLPHENGLMGLSHAGWHYYPGIETLPEYLAAANYRTALIGLQHEDLDARTLGFEEVHGLGFLPRALEVAKLSAEWLSSTKDDSRPFFAAIGLWEVHRPWPAEDYTPADPADVWVPPYLPDNEHTRNDISHFYGAIEQMDQAVGSILDAIETNGLAENTLVIFTTDHGVAFPGAKSTLYDRGVKVAFIARPPRSWQVAPGRTSRIISHLDVVPTLLAVAGAPAPATLSGFNQLELLQGAPEDQIAPRELVLEKTYHDRYDPIRALRTPTTKYIHNFIAAPRLPLPTDLEASDTRKGMSDEHLAPRAQEELYLLSEDPWELNNVAERGDLEDVRNELRERLFELLRGSADPLVEGSVSPPPAPARHGSGSASSIS